MKLTINTDVPSLAISQVIPTLGLARVTREGDGLYLDYLERQGTSAVRLVLFAADARKMIAELQSALLALTPAAGNSPSTAAH